MYMGSISLPGLSGTLGLFRFCLGALHFVVLDYYYSLTFTRLTNSWRACLVLRALWLKYIAAVWCSWDMAMLGGVDPCIFVTGKPRRAWVVVHGIGARCWLGGRGAWPLRNVEIVFKKLCVHTVNEQTNKR